MAASSDSTPNTSKFKNENVMTGPLPHDFLRIPVQSEQVMVNQLSHQMVQPNVVNGIQQNCGLLTVTIVQARLAKNYGVTRMDPYCRLRIGIQVFETMTAYNGAKTPRWNKSLNCRINDQVNEIYLEMFDERTFSIDERIALGMIKISDEVLAGNIVDEWYPLSGKQGDGKEGMIQIVLQYKKMQEPILMGGPIMMPPVGYGQQPVYGYPPVMYGHPAMVSTTQQQQLLQQQMLQQQFQQQQLMQQQQSQQPVVNEINEQDLKTLKEMCPELDEEIIKSVLLQAGGNVDRAAAQLLEMTAS